MCLTERAESSSSKNMSRFLAADEFPKKTLVYYTNIIKAKT